jgi:nucleotide-binding universal stress UspA family protein
VSRAGGSPNVDVYFDTGAPHVCILERARALGAELIVLGAAEGSDRPSKTAQRVLRAATTPVLIARGPSAGPILAASDLSDPSITALQLAVRQAEALGRELHVVNVVDLERETGWLNSVKRLSPKGAEAYLSRAHEAMDKAQTDLTMLLAKHAPNAKGHIDHGRTAAAIGKRARELGASILVVATHGRTGVDRALVGSVAEELAGAAPCSVLVVRHGD